MKILILNPNSIINVLSIRTAKKNYSNIKKYAIIVIIESKMQKIPKYVQNINISFMYKTDQLPEAEQTSLHTITPNAIKVIIILAMANPEHANVHISIMLQVTFPCDHNIIPNKYNIGNLMQ